MGGWITALIQDIGNVLLDFRRRFRRSWVRYEFLVPTRYNEGDSVEPLKFECLGILLTEFFQGYSRYAGTGRWESYPEERHVRYQVDVPDRKFNREFFEYFRRVLEKWFRQERIWMNRIKIEVV